MHEPGGQYKRGLKQAVDWKLVICYLLSPLMKFMENWLFLPLGRALYRKSKKSGGKKFARVLSILFAEIILILVLVALVYLIIPQMLSKARGLVEALHYGKASHDALSIG